MKSKVAFKVISVDDTGIEAIQETGSFNVFF